MNKLVSIVVTCYNHEKYIKQCLESIISQTYPNLEIIIYNDGSTDNSDKYIEEFVGSFTNKNIQYFSQENIGLSPTRNQAFNIINGVYLLFVDSDNFLEENYVESMVKIAESQNADLIYTTLKNADNGEIITQAREFDLQEFYRGNFIDSCSLLRVSKIGNIRYDSEYRKLEDYDFFFNLIVKNNVFPKPCYETFLNYRVLSDSMSKHGELEKYYDAYSRIISKFAYANQEYAETALKFNFSQLCKLDIDYSMKKETMKVYFSETEEFGDSVDFESVLKSEDEISFKVPEGIKYLRIRPSNIPSFYEHVNVISKDKVLKPKLSNGYIIEDKAIFRDFYPFIDYELPSGIKAITIAYKRFNISDIVSDEYVAKKLAKYIFEQKDKIENLNKSYDELKHEFDVLNDSYKIVIESKRWKLVTKIVNIFRRNK